MNKNKTVLKLSILFVFGLTLTFGFFTKVKAESTNLITNPSVEIPNSINLPQDWIKNTWGVNTATFTYENAGQEGSKSLKVEITNQTSGDSKWYFNEIPVSPNTKYTFSDYYRSSVPSSIDLSFTSGNGATTYKWLGQPVPSQTWKKIEYSFNTPANVTKMTVFHSIDSVGYLQTDNFFLGKVDQPTVIITNNVPNSSLEQSTAEQPSEWQTDTWLNNTAKFSYLNEGRTGSHSVKTEITSYTSGDSKWYYTPQKIEAGKYYEFSDYYKSNVASDVCVEVKKSNGTYQYISLKGADPSLDWNRYSDRFSMPASAVSATVFHVIAGVGYLITDDYSLAAIGASPTGFVEPIITLTLDDGWNSAYTNALPLLNKYSARGTFFIVSRYIGFSNYMTENQIYGLVNAGNEIGSHTVNHKNLTTLSSNDLNFELAQSQKDLQKFGAIKNFASPYGAFNSTTIAATKQYYSSHRSVQEGFNTKDNIDFYNIKVQNVHRDTTPTEIESWITKAKTDRSWLVLVYHQIDNGSDYYGTTAQEFEHDLNFIKSNGLTTKTISEAISTIIPQL